MTWKPVCLAVVMMSSMACIPDLTCDGCLGGGDEAEAWVPPENDWPSAVPPTDVTSASPTSFGFNVGQVIPDVRAIDQHGDEVSLWQFHGQVTLLDASTMWCGPCRMLAMSTEETFQHFKKDGFMYVTILHQTDDSSIPPTQEDLEVWAEFPTYEEFGGSPEQAITAPVLADPNGSLGTAPMVINNQYPALVLVDRELRVVRRIETTNPEVLDAAIEEYLAEEGS